MTSTISDERLTVVQVAQRCGVHEMTVRNWMNPCRGVRGLVLATLRIGGRVFVTEDSLAKFLGDLNAGQTNTPAQRAVASVLREKEDKRRAANLERLLSSNPLGTK